MPPPSLEKRRHHHGHVVQLTQDNFQTEIGKHPLALVNFGANWCKWTRALLPEFNAASKVRKALPQIYFVYLLLLCGGGEGRQVVWSCWVSLYDYVRAVYVHMNRDSGAAN